MLTLYRILIKLVEKILPLSSYFSPKMKLFVQGRKTVFKVLSKQFSSTDKVIWMHAASLGEYEQGLPVLKEIKARYPTYKILISFFSPSGYEVKKNNSYADLTTYLPLDTQTNAKRFVKLVHPKLALFIKYEIWPNYLTELYKQSIPTLLISGNFRPNQIYFKAYGGFMKRALQSLDHLFVQTKASQQLLESQGIHKVTYSGDTRYDRVNAQLEMDNHLDFVEEFKGNRVCIVCGSTWPEDENLFLDFINQAENDIAFIIAPHQIKVEHLEALQNGIKKSSLLFSQRSNQKLKDFQVLIIDAVGFLSKVYAYADIAYVGGAAGKTGLHNILEPATFGVPILIGENHQNFPEASALEKAGGLFVVKNPKECTKMFRKLTKQIDFRLSAGQKSRQFIENGRGATASIIKYIEAHLKL